MPNSVRAAQLADLIRDYLAAWIHAEYPGGLVSVTDDTLTPDLRQATVWLSSFTPAGEKAVRELMGKERAYTHRLRKASQRRATPDIFFQRDLSEAERARLFGE